MSSYLCLLLDGHGRVRTVRRVESEALSSACAIAERYLAVRLGVGYELWVGTARVASAGVTHNPLLSLS